MIYDQAGQQTPYLTEAYVSASSAIWRDDIIPSLLSARWPGNDIFSTYTNSRPYITTVGRVGHKSAGCDSRRFCSLTFDLPHLDYGDIFGSYYNGEGRGAGEMRIDNILMKMSDFVSQLLAINLLWCVLTSISWRRSVARTSLNVAKVFNRSRVALLGRGRHMDEWVSEWVSRISNWVLS